MLQVVSFHVPTGLKLLLPCSESTSENPRAQTMVSKRSPKSYKPFFYKPFFEEGLKP